MKKIVVFEFPYNGPWGEEMASAMRALAQDIANEPGLVWKIWTEDRARGVAGGVYLFESGEDAQRYTAKHSARLAGFGITGIDARSFDINAELTALDHGAKCVPG